MCVGMIYLFISYYMLRETSISRASQTFRTNSNEVKKKCINIITNFHFQILNFPSFTHQLIASLLRFNRVFRIFYIKFRVRSTHEA